MATLRSSTLREYTRLFDAVTDYIDENFQLDIGIDDFCKERHYSRRSTQRALQYRGTSWKTLLRERRLREAANRLLHTDWSVKQIAAFVGYMQSAHLAYVFRLQYGLTPREYRQTFNGRAHGTEE